MSTQLRIVLFTVVVTAFYTYVGAIVPQMEGHPPRSVEVGENLSPTELANAGRQVFFGKGTCALCHTIGEQGQRCPDLEGVGARAGDRVEGMSAQDYLLESLLQPNSYIVDGYTPTMPRIDRPPIGLARGEIIAVVAFLQSQGGEITVNPRSSLPFPDQDSAAATVPGAGKGGHLDPSAIVAKYGCGACHQFTAPGRLLGPSLYDVGARQDRGKILESIVDPDAAIAEGNPPYPAGIMSATLTAGGFYDTVSLAELNALVDYLAGLRGESP